MNKQTKNNGIGCLTAVGIVFLILKLLAIEPVASWSWWWVLCPFWIQLVIGILIAIGIFVFAFAIGSRRRN